MNEFDETIKKLEKYNQEKLKNIFLKIDKKSQEELSKEIMNMDFEQISSLYKDKDKNIIKKNEIEPIDCIDKNKIKKEDKNKFYKKGRNIIKQGKYAVVTMAGGQGTRLGWNGPKGTYKLDIGKNVKYIFEILTDTLKRACNEYNIDINWYIMTSIENNEQTISFFEENNYFGYNKECVKFFKQDVLPLLDEDGNLLLDNNFNIKKASDGNGCVYKALNNSKMLEDMKNKGIEWVYVCGVDNIMANMVDSLLLGVAVEKNFVSASKSVKKLYPEEKVGIFCKKNGKPAIIEYIDMDQEMIYAKNEDGELLYGESNILGHLFNIKGIEEISKYNLKYHCAKKKNSYIDEDLQEINPKEPNAYKFESFIFDGFKYLDNMIIMRVNREEEFAPIKNAAGVDSPSTAKQIYENYWKK